MELGPSGPLRTANVDLGRSSPLRRVNRDLAIVDHGAIADALGETVRRP